MFRLLPLVAFPVTMALAAGPQIVILDGNGQVLQEGEFAKAGQTYPKRTVIRVLDANGNRVPNTPVTWSVPNFEGRWWDGPLSVTDANGESSNAFVAPEYLGLGNSFKQTAASASALGITAPLNFTTIARQVDGFPNPFPSATRIAPANTPPTLIGEVGQVITGAIKYQFTNTSRLQGGLRLPNIGMKVIGAPGGPTVDCVQGPIVLSDSLGVATCDLRITGRSGLIPIYLELGGGYTTGNDPYILLNALPAGASQLKIAGGNNQTGSANLALSTPLTVFLDDGTGTGVPNVTISWQVTQGTATLTTQTSVTDAQGRASTGVRLGTQAGQVLVRATAQSGSFPSTTFTLNINDPRPTRVVFLDRFGALGIYDRVSGEVYNGGGILSGAVSAATNSNGDTYIVGRDPGGSLWMRSFLSNRSWGPWLSAGGWVQGTPAIALNSNGTPMIVAQDNWGAYWARTYSGFLGFSSWIYIGGIFASDPSITAIGQTYYITGRDKYNTVWMASYTIGATPALSWQFVGGVVAGKPSIGAGPSGPIIAARDTYGGHYVYYSGLWQKMPGLSGADPVILANSTSTAYLSLVDPWSTLYYLPVTLNQSTVTPGSLVPLGIFGDFSPTYTSGQFSVFGRDKYGTVWFGVPGSGSMQQIGLAGIVVSPPSAARN
ncbi:MAG: Ig-like domain-containing protein [Bryobacterales bacterium]|nr:Ig-like domain-containing protein [Bryobacterales bacterium]